MSIEASKPFQNTSTAIVEPVPKTADQREKVDSLFQKIMREDFSLIIDPLERRAYCQTISSIFGLPGVNNRALLQQLLIEYGIDKRREESLLNDLLSMPRPTENHFTLEPMRRFWIENGLKEKYKNSPLHDVLFPENPREDEHSQAGRRRYTIAVVKEIGARKIVSGKTVAEGIDDEKTKDFLKLISLLDPSAATLWGVHFTLWIGAVLKSGTEKHEAAFLQDSEEMNILGSCLMTELGHGSNVKGLQTTAEFDPETGEFILNSPMLTSLKWWPGGLAQNSTHAVVFAQLIFEGKKQGVHSFAFQFRGSSGKNFNGITTGDIGAKQGLNGIDNGWCRFDNMRIPFDALLNKRGWIEKKEGKYVYDFDTKTVRSPEKIYIKEMEQYVRGRQTICYSSVLLQQVAAFIFDLYPPASLTRELHHHYLCEMLSSAYMHQCAESLIEGPYKDDHIRASVMKSILSSSGGDRLSQLEFLYGGSFQNRRLVETLKGIQRSQVATQIYEGDNYLLLLLGSSQILNKDIRNNSQKWEEEVGVFDPENPETLKKVSFEQRPILLLKWGIFQCFCKIRDRMMQVVGEGKNPQDEFMTGSGAGQREAIEAGRLWGQMLILENACQKISQIEASDPQYAEDLWALYTIYADSVCNIGPKPYSQSELFQARESLKGAAYDQYRTHHLCAKLLLPLEWIDVVLTPPGKSISYGDERHKPQAKL